MAAKKSSPLKIIPLGGLDGIGNNMTVFECGDDMVLVDAGLMFPDDSQPGIDLVLPDYTYVLENEEKLRGIIVTHGHEDHTGSLPYLLQDLNNKVPIFSSKLTLGFIEGKLSEFRIRAPKFREVKGGSHVNLGGISLDFFSMTHSIPGALGVFIRTNQGTVMHTGDFKLDQTPIDGVTPDYAAISRFAKQGIDLLLSDSTNATVPGFTKSEAEVGPNLLHAIKNAPGRVFVASFSSHIHRLQQICDAARKCGRKVVVTGRSMLTNTRVARELGYLNIDDADIIDAFDIDNLPDDKIVVMCTGSQGEPLSALSRMANGEHKTLSIHEGDTVILSATPVPGNEKAVQQVVNSLAKLGCDVWDKNRALVHVSGHGSQEELKLLMAMAKPTYFMPVTARRCICAPMLSLLARWASRTTISLSSTTVTRSRCVAVSSSAVRPSSPASSMSTACASAIPTLSFCAIARSSLTTVWSRLSLLFRLSTRRSRPSSSRAAVFRLPSMISSPRMPPRPS